MERYIYFQRVTAVEERFREDYSEMSEPDEKGKRRPKQVSTGWWLVFDDKHAFRLGSEKPEDEDGKMTIRPGDRMKFTMERA